jgi:hypothetical protein
MTKQTIIIVLKMGSIGGAEKSVRNYHYLLCNNAEEQTAYSLCGRSLKSHFMLTFYCIVQFCWQFERLNPFLWQIFSVL